MGNFETISPEGCSTHLRVSVTLRCITFVNFFIDVLRLSLHLRLQPENMCDPPLTKMSNLEPDFSVISFFVVVGYATLFHFGLVHLNLLVPDYDSNCIRGL